MRDLDRTAIERFEIPGFTLMSRAGQSALAILRKRWPGARRLLVLCGAGNNAGDGYVVARLAALSGMQVTTVALVNPGQLQGDAELAWNMYRQGGGSSREWDPALLEGCDLVVDAILGTGLARQLEGKPYDVVAAVNASARPVLAIDIPTGLHADTGHAQGIAVHADVTITFVGLKLGLYTGDGPDYVGEVFFDSLGIPEQAYEGTPHAGTRIGPDDVQAALPRRSRTAHKGDNGRVLLIGGGTGMAGAICLAAEAALHAGAGLVTAATLPEHVPVVVTRRPEVIARGVTARAGLAPLLRAADVVAIGPGLGQDAWAKAMLEAALDSGKPMVVDADALNLLAMAPCKRDDWVLTPHPGEAARLLSNANGEETQLRSLDIQTDRVSAAARLIDRYGGVLVLKGSGTIVARNGELPGFCDRGNPGMAAAGMGDVLTGVIAAVAAQCEDLFAAARAGAWVHAAAGDDAASAGERGILASDLFAHIVTHVNQY